MGPKEGSEGAGVPNLGIPSCVIVSVLGICEPCVSSYSTLVWQALHVVTV